MNTWPHFYPTNKNKYPINEDEAVDDGFDVKAWRFICDFHFYFVLIAFDQVELCRSVHFDEKCMCKYRWESDAISAQFWLFSALS